ncbi:MAG: hydrogenase [Deltaproteobacteria bacterium]|nr:hydrogenase [Deltaproteobacteria bacterium]
MSLISVVPPLLALVFAPLLLSLINRTKAVVAGRRGQPLSQPYRDLWKLLHKGAVYSRTTTWVFRAGPMVGLSAVLIALVVTPFGNIPALLAFPGDAVFFAYLLGLMRFWTILAALDTGSSFEGMGASREATYAALTEPALFLGLAAIARHGETLSLSPMFAHITSTSWGHAGPAFALLAAAFFVVFLTENARIPIDDPTTHLELTMIHEVMVLDHGGPDFAFILYGGALKLWILGALLVGVLVPVRSGVAWLDLGAAVAGLVCLAILTGVIESSMARLRLVHIPQLLVGAGVLSALALVLVLR